MSKNSGFSQGINMPARKKQGPVVVDLMRPGNGTPWEDRGHVGVISAYFTTALKSFTSPALLMDHIRRPESNGDAAVFAIVSAVMWAIGILVYNGYWVRFALPKYLDYYEPDVDMTFYWLTAVGQAALVGGGVFLWQKIGSNMYRSLAGAELKGTTSSLTYNCVAYSLGPSLLSAVIPIILLVIAFAAQHWPNVPPQLAIVFIFAWGLAGVWIVFDLIAAGKRRLYMKTSSAVINPIMMAICAFAIAVVAYFVLHFVWSKTLGLNGLTPRATPLTPAASVRPAER